MGIAYRIVRPIFQRAMMIGKPSTATIEVGDVTANVNQPTLERANEIDLIQSETPYLSECLDKISSDDVFWDIGAHHGIVSILAAKSEPSATVVAIEAVDENVEILNSHLRQNDVAESVTVIKDVLSNSEEKMTFYKEDSGVAGRHRLTNSEETENFVYTTTGEKLISNDGIPTPDIIKLDVEGAELPVLRGIGDYLHECRSIFIELHTELYDEYDYGEHDLTEYLKQRGFSVAELKLERGERFLIVENK